MRPDPWIKLKSDEARRVDSRGRHDFFWVVLDAGMPGLMFRLACTPEPLPKLPKFKNLEIGLRSAGEGMAFVLGLKEKAQVEIFETLCRDVVSAGETEEDTENALRRVLQRTRRWHHLLRGGTTGGLSLEEQRGLVGELALLRKLVKAFGPEAAIEAWKGPMGAAKDFEFIEACIEVKAHRAAAKPYVTISSEDQLADVSGARLFLRVIDVSSGIQPEGMNLHDHVRETAALFLEPSVEFEAWEEAITAAGYDADDDYEERRWLVGTTTDYEVGVGFPRITSPLPVGLGNVKYAISLSACSPFELRANLMSELTKGKST